jgi:hypothetical protein
MIQRVQTLYLIGAALISVICLFIQMCIWPMALVLGLSLLINIYTIFLYNNRKLQAKFCLFSILLLVCWYILYVVCWNIFTSDDVKEYLHPLWSAVLPFVSMIFSFLARKAIIADENLVRAADRIR